MFDTLDAIMATAAVILGLSLVVQAIQQILKQFFDIKSTYMRAVLLALFKRLDPKATGAASDLQKDLATNWTSFKTLARNAGTFAETIVNDLETKLNTFGFRDLHLIEKMEVGKFKEIAEGLSSVETLAAEQRENMMKEIDRWFEISKQAFQEHYERRMKPWAFFIGAVVVVALNANFFDIYREFARSKTLRESGVALTQQFLSVSKDDLIRQYSQPTDTSGNLSDSVRVEIMRKKAAQVQSLLDEQAFQVLRWSESRIAAMKNTFTFWNYISLVLGWFATTLLVSLGAPFWYDVLKAITGVKDKLKTGAGSRSSP
jgi:putative Mn2+ efflux pump MntP